MTTASRTLALSVVLLLASSLGWASATQPSPGGTVTLPIDIYTALLQAGSDPSKPPAPVGYAVGNSRLTVQVQATEAGRNLAQLSAQLSIEVLRDDWVVIPLLPSGVALDSAQVNGSAVQLIATSGGLGWATEGRGKHTIQLAYRADVVPSPGGWSLPFPVPGAASTALTASLPGSGFEVAVIPASGVQSRNQGSTTSVQATLPATLGALMTWSSAAKAGLAVGRAEYRGELRGDAFFFEATFDADVLGERSERLQLLPISVTLSELLVDGKAAPILVENGHFVTPIRGKGRHTVTATFEAPVAYGDGPPRIDLPLPEVPASRFELTLPGNRKVAATPAAAVAHRRQGETTLATVNVGLSRQVSFQWSEAVPEEATASARINATVFHTARAEEGVLFLSAWPRLEISRGAINRVRLNVPAGVEIDQVGSPSGAVMDWRIEVDAKGNKTAVVFLDREVREALLLEMHYERPLPAELTSVLPLIEVADVQRQRGVMALLSGAELSLEPIEEMAFRLGADQLPPFLLAGRGETVAHAFKYGEDPPEVTVRAVAPERVPGRFDATIDTLVSVGEVSQRGSVAVDVDVKAGSLETLSLRLPTEVSLLSLTGPSVREHQVAESGGGQIVEVAFNQELTGRFRLDLVWEQLISGAESSAGTGLPVPMLHVQGSEVEQGFLAVEALEAVEVRAATVDELTVVDVDELPRRLILRTSHPVLLAFKYARTTPGQRLALAVQRHRLMEVQEATIDSAEYHTLFTRDGLAVTKASFWVRNSRQQFLALSLPEGAEIWSAFVNGRSEKPALPTEGYGNKVLLKIIHSTEGFPVEITWADDTAPLGRLGKLRSELPTPDILATKTRWDVYVPNGLRYQQPDTNMDVVQQGATISADKIAASFKETGSDTTRAPLRVDIPIRGQHFAFEKLYANRAENTAWISLRYSTKSGSLIGYLLSVIAVLLIAASSQAERWFPNRTTLVMRRIAFGSGLVALVVTVGIFGVSAWPAAITTILLALLPMVMNNSPRLRARVDA